MLIQFTKNKQWPLAYCSGNEYSSTIFQQPFLSPKMSPIVSSGAEFVWTASSNTICPIDFSSNGDFTILFQANQKVPLYVDSDRFTLEDTSCEIFMDFYIDRHWQIHVQIDRPI